MGGNKDISQRQLQKLKEQNRQDIREQKCGLRGRYGTKRPESRREATVGQSLGACCRLVSRKTSLFVWHPEKQTTLCGPGKQSRLELHKRLDRVISYSSHIYKIYKQADTSEGHRPKRRIHLSTRVFTTQSISGAFTAIFYLIVSPLLKLRFQDGSLPILYNLI